MDMQSGRIAEQTELRTTGLRLTGAGRTDLADLGELEDLGDLEELGELVDALAEPEPEPEPEPAADADGAAGDAGERPQDADDPAWDYEDVILRSVN
ncbi:hypothetical protein ACFV6F_17300 [Kitasatospora phosalacinea]|uniref:hypothetical protein n=1 Tax=Kitasatospora phosalacinea TaxID=2065 RepID=UPI0036646F02